MHYIVTLLIVLLVFSGIDFLVTQRHFRNKYENMTIGNLDGTPFEIGEAVEVHGTEITITSVEVLQEREPRLLRIVFEAHHPGMPDGKNYGLSAVSEVYMRVNGEYITACYPTDLMRLGFTGEFASRVASEFYYYYGSASGQMIFQVPENAEELVFIINSYGIGEYTADRKLVTRYELDLADYNLR